MPYKSSIERYRAGELGDPPYDFDDPVDRAIWTAVGMYVDHRALVDLAGGEPEGPEPWKLEENLEEIAAHVRGEAVMPSSDARAVARTVVDALFGDPGGPTVISPEFWDAGEPEERLAESALEPNRSIAALSSMIRSAYGELVSQADVARRLGIPRPTAADLIRRKGIPVVRVGRRFLIPESELEELAR